MLPPGHVAAGFLAAEALLKIIKPDLSPAELKQLVWWMMFWSFAPDLDTFVAFTRVKSFWYKPGVNSGIHRQFYSHIPLLWLVAGLSIFGFASTTYGRMFGLTVWLGSWTHFLLDSIEYGVMWLWPMNRELWALWRRGVRMKIDSDGFFDYWKKFLQIYITRPTFYLEMILLLSAIILIQFNH